MSRSAYIKATVGMNTYEFHAGSRALPEFYGMTVGTHHVVSGQEFLDVFNNEADPMASSNAIDAWTKALGLSCFSFLFSEINGDLRDYASDVVITIHYLD